MDERSALMRNLSAVGFAMLDLHLFLNTHPHNASAISLYTQYKQRYQVLSAEYEQKYGPLTALNGVSGDTWKWVQSPWPWQETAGMEV